ncbi:hypothetical protein [Devosia sp. CN2-171]|uniref:COG3904 family protein n=1 Tax=Devosia sp. CN2-171 TaxID=3400909 RepID=UPI003BF7C71A
MSIRAHLLAVLAVAWAGLALAEQPPKPIPRPAEFDLRIGAFYLPGDLPDTLVMDGPLKSGAFDDFVRAIGSRPHAIKLVTASPGGLVNEALAVARVVRARSMVTAVPAKGECYSACAFVFLAGGKRTIAAGGLLGVHQMYGGSESATATQLSVAALFEAMRSFGVQDPVIVEMLRTPPEKLHIFTESELEAYGIVSKRGLDTPVRQREENGSIVALVRSPPVSTEVVIPMSECDLPGCISSLGFDDELARMIAEPLEHVVGSHVGAGTVARLLLGPAAGSPTLIPWRVSLYRQSSGSHLATAALNDRGNYIAAIAPQPAMLGGYVFKAPSQVEIPTPSSTGKTDRARPAAQ